MNNPLGFQFHHYLKKQKSNSLDFSSDGFLVQVSPKQRQGTCEGLLTVLRDVVLLQGKKTKKIHYTSVYDKQVPFLLGKAT